MNNILITGGLGHIGSHLIKTLSDEYNLTIVDNLLTQRYCSLFNTNRKIKFKDCGFEDMSTEDLNKYDIVIHLAAVANAALSASNRDMVYDVNVTRTKAFIDRVSQSKIKLFIFPSSTSVYGKGLEIMYESDDNICPQSPYAESKVEIEEYLKLSDVDHITFRFGTIFGTSIGMRFHTAINSFCYQAAFDKKLTVWRENYEHYRPYLGLDDAAQAIELVLKRPESYNQTYNVLSNNYKLSDIIQHIKGIKKVDIEFVDTPLINQFTYCVNFDKIKSLGYKPNDDLSKAIFETMRLFK